MTTALPMCNGTYGSAYDLVEQERLRVLEELGLIDTPESEAFDRITRMATQLLNAPVAAVSLTDRSRQWFKSSIGTGGREIPRAGAPCAEVTRTQQFLYVPNMLEDERFADCLLAQGGGSVLRRCSADDARRVHAGEHVRTRQHPQNAVTGAAALAGRLRGDGDGSD